MDLKAIVKKIKKPASDRFVLHHLFQLTCE